MTRDADDAAGAGRRPLRVAAVAVETRVGDVQANVARVRDGIGAAADRGAQLVVVPELAVSGYAFADAAEAAAASVRPDAAVWRQLADALPPGAVAVVGYAEDGDGSTYNTAAVLTRNRRLGDYRKAHLWGAERSMFASGDSGGALIDTPVGRLGVAICYDNEFPEVPRRLALAGAEILALPVAWPLLPRPAGEHPPELIQAMAAARSSRLATVVADNTGEDRDIVWTGGTAVVDDDGWIAARSEEPGIALAELQLRHPSDKSLPPYNDLFADRRPELY